MKTRIRNCVARMLVAGLVAQATPSGAEMIRPDLEQAGVRERIANVLARDDVRAELLVRGVDPAYVDARVAALTDHEATLLASQLDRLPAGGGGSPVEAVAMIVYAVLLIAAAIIVVPVFLVAKAVKASKRTAPAEAESRSELQPAASE